MIRRRSVKRVRLVLVQKTTMVERTTDLDTRAELGPRILHDADADKADSFSKRVSNKQGLETIRLTSMAVLHAVVVVFRLEAA